MFNHRIVEIDNSISQREYIKIKNVLDKYNIESGYVEKKRSVYKIINEDKSYCLKKISNENHKVVNGMMLVKYLHNNGFFYVADYIKSKDGKEYVKYEGSIYYLTTWIDGRECDFENFEELKNAIELMANFHMKSKGFHTSNTKIESNNKRWPDIFEKRRKDILKYNDIIEKKKIKSTFDIEYQKVSEKFIKMINMAQELLQKSNYMMLSKQAFEDKTVCHDSFYYQNILINEKKELYLIDLDSILYDIWVYDLAKFIRRILYRKVYGWNFEVAKKIIDEYRRINPLSDEELEILLAFLIFPHKFWKLGKKKYDKKKQWSEGKYINRIEKILKYSDKQETFAKRYIEEYNIFKN